MYTSLIIVFCFCSVSSPEKIRPGMKILNAELKIKNVAPSPGQIFFAEISAVTKISTDLDSGPIIGYQMSEFSSLGKIIFTPHINENF